MRFIQLNYSQCLYFSGMRQVSDEEVITAHHGTKLSVEEVGYLGVTTNMFQYVDIFSIPEITIFRDVTQVGENISKSLDGNSSRFSISLTIVFHLLLNTFITMFE